ncbi:SDR family NAD(P)-dependent oxidoreductase [Sapientia aquatica]|uniref:SDR family oxidoreductase n=1 Tax=Sapientia aquatica TaxID=1549640 RepID=A0A4R5W172_9BURK|nr:SDR family NAD(P)-dependent oxidoreductase [Sapientia aquatica]TDK65654.1 SDR family oxidoreductase [Sapientia aquatica]
MTDLNALFQLEGKKALITGASSGLGEHFAQVMAQHGVHVVLAARNVFKLHQLVEHIRSNGGRAHAISLDITSSASVLECFDQIDQLVGTVDVLVNNAGLSNTKPAVQQTEDEWDAILQTNLKGTWLMATEAARRMIAANRPGSIVNIASILGQRVSGHVAPYSISKAGVLQATKALALELARYGIRVNALMPGYVATNLNQDFLNSDAGEKLRARIPSKRFGAAGDLDGPLLLLASEAGRHITGACLAVDGGHLVSAL